jgi:hypothetical protein
VVYRELRRRGRVSGKSVERLDITHPISTMRACAGDDSDEQSEVKDFAHNDADTPTPSYLAPLQQYMNQ